MRATARSKFFGAVRHVANIEDSRRILTDAVHLQPYVSCTPELAACQELEAPYPELGRRETRVLLPHHRRPLFITGRFRSGSTLLWQLFRALPGVTCYYEPFNERRWFDPATRGNHVDPTHINAEDYWAEYDGLTQLGALYSEEWTRRQLYMDASAWNGPMQQYVQTLIDHADGRAVLQFNRVDMRLPWLRARFPEAELLHIYRNPRDQWCSTLPRVEFDTTQLRLRDFAADDGFYLLNWGRDLQYFFPFLTLDGAAHPYELFYQVWKLSYLFGRAYSDLSVCFEHLIQNPEREVSRMMTRFGFEPVDLQRLLALVAPIDEGKWRKQADGDFFAAIEARVDRIFDQYFGAHVQRPEMAGSRANGGARADRRQVETASNAAQF
ncbi:MAG: sulfotransferase [Steroidobacteraceae bacterium]